ncbi:MAG TPA: hypothetical protein VGI39_12450 [Polyangiaceae bacterium]|jgi:hypothetical protein
MRFRAFVPAFFFLASALASASTARAQTAPLATFDAVTSYSAVSTMFTITGVQHGASAPSTVQLISGSSDNPATAALSSCEKQILVMMNRPGRFSLAVFSQYGDELGGCSLTQLP